MEGLSEKTRAIYSKAIADICRAFNSESLEILKDHARIVTWIESLDKSINTKKIYYISLVSTIQRMNDPSFATALKEYKAKQNSYNNFVSARYEQQEKSQREEENWLEWPDILKAREAARLSACDFLTQQDYVILCLYTHHVPVRLDYSPMAVVYEETPDQRGNRLLVLPTGLTFIIEDYKTSRKYGVQRIPVSKELALILLDWLEVNQSGWLLIDSKGGPMTETNLGIRISAILKRHTGKAASLNIIRHSCVSWVRRKEKPVKETAAVAKGMLHSIGMNTMYRKL